MTFNLEYSDEELLWLPAGLSRGVVVTDEAPCIGLDPDTDPCPYCGVWLSDQCPFQE